MNNSILLLILGLILLLASGKYLVESSVVIARHFRIPTIIIGLTIVSFGTSAPELLVSLQAALQGFPDMAIGNVVGSNISNILLVLAITAFIFPIHVEKQFIRKDWPILMLISCLLLVFVIDMELRQYEGFVMLGMLFAYVIYTIYQGKKPENKDMNGKEQAPKMRWWLAALIFIAACVGLSFGADLLVKNASIIAEDIGVSERVISISMVAVGTSLPELATSMIAAFKKEASISVGNIIGSNIMNIISVLGITSSISPLKTVTQTRNFDLPFMLFATLLLYLFMGRIGRGKIDRLEGGIMLLVYAGYIIFIFIQ